MTSFQRTSLSSGGSKAGLAAIEAALLLFISWKKMNIALYLVLAVTSNKGFMFFRPL